MRHEIDRANAQVHLRRADLTIGRQAIGWGRGVMFTSVDLFAPFSPLEVDREWRGAAHPEEIVALRAPQRVRSRAVVRVAAVALVPLTTARGCPVPRMSSWKSHSRSAQGRGQVADALKHWGSTS
jgi:hypothetical protein